MSGGRHEADAPTPFLPSASSADLTVFAALALIALLGLAPVYAGPGFLLAAVGGLLVGGGAALAARWAGLGGLGTALLGIAAYFALGTPLAVPSLGLAFLVPTLDSLSALALGAVFSWRDALTLQTPIGAPEHVVVLPYAAAWLAALLGASLVVRWLPRAPRSLGRRGVVLAIPVALLALSLVAGTSEPFLGVARGATFALLALVHTGWSTTRADAASGIDPRGAGERGNGSGRPRASSAARRGLLRRRLAGTAVLGVVAVAVGAGAGALADAGLGADRLVVRDRVTPPFDPAEHDSPLAGFREYTKERHDDVLMTVAGLRPGDAIRLAVLDRYSGKKWEVASAQPAPDGSGGGATADTGAYELVTSDVPVEGALTSSNQRDVDIRIAGYDDVWMPSVGVPTRIDLAGGDLDGRRSELRYNARAAAAVVTGGLRAGDEYEVRASLQDAPIEGQLDHTPVERLDYPQGPRPPASLVERMQTFIAGETSPYLQLRAIEQGLRSQGYLSHGTAADAAPSRAGHGLDRMQELFDQRSLVGDEEQYASAMALMARELGFPSRVVVGFAPKGATPEGDPVDVRGGDVTAWVEVPFEGFGWVAFHPTPEQTDVPVNTASEPQTKPRAQVRQPPQTERRTEDLVTAAEQDSRKDEDADPLGVPQWVWAVGGAVAVPLAAYLLPLAALAGVRAVRRSRRRHPSRPSDERAAGAWDETVDRLAELGYAIPRRATRAQTAEAVHPGLGPVALAVDRAVFGGDAATDAEVEGVWSAGDEIVDGERDRASFWRRRLAGFRLAALVRDRDPDGARRRNEALSDRPMTVRTPIIGTWTRRGATAASRAPSGRRGSGRATRERRESSE